MAELIAKPPEECVGPSSEQAGKASACAGCPNQKICATAPKGPDPDMSAMAERLSIIKHKLLVLSGKGGVGKSTFSAQLSFALAQTGAEVGLLDVDICGPSIPKMLGLEGEQIHSSNLGWSPVYVQDNLGVMSVGFMLGSDNDAVIWRGPRKNALIKQFLMDVYWEGGLDFLVVDTPPGTSDEHLSISAFLKQSGDVGHAIIITTPQDVALIDVRKEINFCKKVGIPILGVVENMSAFVCPKCQKETTIFGSTSGGAEAMAKDMGVPFLGRIPLDPTIAKACDSGKSYVEDFPESVATKQFLAVFKKIMAAVNVQEINYEK